MRKFLVLKSAFLFILLFYAAALGQKAKPASNITPHDMFPNFPKLRMGMSFTAAKTAVKKSGGRPVYRGAQQEELVWEGVFADTSRRATMLFKKKTGAWEIAFVAYALEKQKDLFAAWTQKIAARQGPATEIHDEELALSHVWRFKNKTALEVRMPKDIHGTVVDIHWVKL